MVRTTATVLAALIVVAGGGRAEAQPQFVELANALGPKAVLLDIDLNGDGPGQGDCDFRLTMDSGGALQLTADQTHAPSSLQIQQCGYAVNGMASSGNNNGSDFLAATMTSTSPSPMIAFPPPLHVPPAVQGARVEFADTSGAGAHLTVGASDIILPLHPNEIRGYASADGPATVVITLCNENGPAGVVNVVDQGSLLVPLSFFTDDVQRTFLKVSHLPFMRSDGMVVLDEYFPTLGHKIIAALENDPDHPFLEIDLDALAVCLGRTMAPTLTEAGLIALLILLLVSGSWRLGRRPAFYQSLPML